MTWARSSVWGNTGQIYCQKHFTPKRDSISRWLCGWGGAVLTYEVWVQLRHHRKEETNPILPHSPLNSGVWAQCRLSLWGASLHSLSRAAHLGPLPKL